MSTYKLSSIIKAQGNYQKKKINSIDDAPDVLKAKVAYNRAIDHIIEFIINYENGTIDNDYVNTLMEHYSNQGK